jgi:hypothetical protein
MIALRRSIMLRCILWVSSALLGAIPVSALDVNVRIISAKTGRPLVHQRVQLTIDGPIIPPETSGSIIGYAWGLTDRSGTAVIHTDLSVPPGSWFLIGYVMDLCSPDRYSVDKVMQTGFSVESPCAHRPRDKFVLPPRPGEIILYSAEYSAGERMLYGH